MNPSSTLRLTWILALLPVAAFAQTHQPLIPHDAAATEAFNASSAHRAGVATGTPPSVIPSPATPYRVHEAADPTGSPLAGTTADATGNSLETGEASTASTWTREDNAYYPEHHPQEPLHPWTTRTAIGLTTTSLLEAQAAGTNAGGTLPTLGATASRTWQRYLDSFNHPLPDKFEESVDSK